MESFSEERTVQHWADAVIGWEVTPEDFHMFDKETSLLKLIGGTDGRIVDSTETETAENWFFVPTCKISFYSFNAKKLLNSFQSHQPDDAHIVS